MLETLIRAAVIMSFAAWLIPAVWLGSFFVLGAYSWLQSTHKLSRPWLLLAGSAFVFVCIAALYLQAQSALTEPFAYRHLAIVLPLIYAGYVACCKLSFSRAYASGIRLDIHWRWAALLASVPLWLCGLGVLLILQVFFPLAMTHSPTQTMPVIP